MPSELTAVLAELKRLKRLCLIYHQHDSDCPYLDYLMHHADALISAAEERDRQALDIRRLQGLAEHLELENQRLKAMVHVAEETGVNFCELEDGGVGCSIPMTEELRDALESSVALTDKCRAKDAEVAGLSEAEEDTRRLDWIIDQSNAGNGWLSDSVWDETYEVGDLDSEDNGARRDIRKTIDAAMRGEEKRDAERSDR